MTKGLLVHGADMVKALRGSTGGRFKPRHLDVPLEVRIRPELQGYVMLGVLGLNNYRPMAPNDFKGWDGCGRSLQLQLPNLKQPASPR